MKRAFSLSLAFLLGVPAPGSAQAENRIQVAEELRIDGHAADLVTIRCLVVARDGTMAACQHQDGALRLFGADGTDLGSVGRQGAGPGEFSSVTRAGRVGDTIWVFDGILGRLSFVAPEERQVVRTSRVVAGARPTAADQGTYPAFNFISPYAVYPDGSIQAGVGAAEGPMVDARYETLVSRFRISEDGILTARILEYDLGEYEFFFRTPSGAAAGGVFPFGIRPAFDVSPDGSRSVLVTTRVSTSTGGTIHVVTVDAWGDTLAVTSVPFTGEPIPRQVADSAIAARTFPNPDLAAAFRRAVRVPPVYPPVEGVVVGSEGFVWLRGRATGDVRPHLVVDPEGQVVGTADLPVTARVMAVARSHIWAVVADELGVQSIVRYRIAM